jgi:hypothetical protein
MRVKAICPALLLVLALTGVAAARLAEGGSYNGNVIGQPGPESGITFNVVKVNGHKRVRDMVLSGIDFTCSGGDPGETPGVAVEGSFRVARDRTFGGTHDSQILAIDPKATIHGRLRRHRRVTGTLRLRGELDPQNQPGVKCDSGVQNWRARFGDRSISARSASRR